MILFWIHTDKRTNDGTYDYGYSAGVQPARHQIQVRGEKTRRRADGSGTTGSYRVGIRRKREGTDDRNGGFSDYQYRAISLAAEISGERKEKETFLLNV